MSNEEQKEAVSQQGAETEIKKEKGFNDATISGFVMKAEKKKSGSWEVWLNTDPSREDTEMKGAAIPSFHTSVIFIRVPKPVVQRIGEEGFVEGANLIVKAFMTGVRRVVEGQSFDVVEVRAKDVTTVDAGKPDTKKRRGVNNVVISGMVENIELKKSGSMEVWLNTDSSRKDTPLKGALVASFFTSTLFVRIPKPIVDRVGKDNIVKGIKAIIPSRLKGVRRVTDGHPYDVVEIQAIDAIPA